jgi:hypothetical protein
VTHRIFLLSPASCAGARARLVLNDGASFDLARAVRGPGGAPLGDVFSFLSGLYFRGKLRYASAFARPPDGVPGVLVITAGDGLVSPQSYVTIDVLRRWAGVRIDLDDGGYTTPLRRDAEALAASLADASVEIVLLGSVASAKYVELLDAVFGERLRFPAEFVGRGDMSRGGLLLRCTDECRELTYVPVAGTTHHGVRPERLTPRPRRESRRA